MINVVLADDDTTVREMYKIRLVQAGMAIYEAADGIEALETTKKIRPDLVILDIMMPKMNGLDVLKFLRSDSEVSRVLVIILTALTQDLSSGGKFAQAADAYLSKSSTMPKDLVDKARSLLFGRGLIG